MRTSVRHQSEWAIAGTFIGTVVGAGFASGQETVQFFTNFGPAGAAGLVLATTLFVGFGRRMLQVGCHYAAFSYQPVVQHAFGTRLAPAVDWLLTLILLATAAAMASGAGATLAEQFGWNRWFGAGLVVVAATATVLTGISGVVAAIAFVAPLLIVSIVVISVYSLSWSGGLQAALDWPGIPAATPLHLWWLSAPLYVAYNMLLAAPVLAPLGAQARDPRAGGRGGLLGGVGLGLGAAAIHFSVAARMPEAAGFDIPMLYTAGTLPGWVPLSYTVLLLSEVYTTAVAMLFGFASRISPSGRRFRTTVLLGGCISLAGAGFRFADVVGTLYPVVGVVGLVLLLGLLRPLPPRV